MPGTGMTREKLERIAAASRTGGNVRRRHKAVRKTSEPEDTKLQGTFRKMGMTPIDVNEVDITMESGDVIRFTNSKVQASPQSNTFVISGSSKRVKADDVAAEQPEA